MLKKILVVSDNPALAKVFAKVWSDLDLVGRASYALRYSSRNANPGGMIELGAEHIDLKNAADLAFAQTFDAVFSIHCKQLFPKDLVASRLCINLHPGFNPHGRGWYPQVFSIIEGRPAGATLHTMDAELDAGRIIARRQVEVKPYDTSLNVYERVQRVEEELLRENLLAIVEETFVAAAPEIAGDVKTIADFRNLCALDLDAVGSLRDHINLLRALTHGNFNNGYFFAEDGTKVFVKIKFDCVE